MNILTDRISYWNKKYKYPCWDERIHFSLLENQDDCKDSFQKGLDFNDKWHCDWILNNVSMHKLTSGAKILDIGSGSGSLLRYLSSIVPEIKCYGLDISAEAVEIAKEKVDKLKIYDHEYQVGTLSDSGIYEKYSENECKYEAIICRDTFYLLGDDERGELNRLVHDCLSETGVFVLTDFAVHKDSINAADELMCKRQFGNTPIIWSHQGKQKNFDFSVGLSVDDLVPVGKPVERENAVAKSYKIAATYIADDNSVKESYKNLVDLAESKVPMTNFNVLTYVSHMFRRGANRECLTPEEEKIISVPLKNGLISKNKKETLLLDNEFSFPEGKFSLLIGRSGCGKSTLLEKLESHLNKFHKSKRFYFLRQSQKPLPISALNNVMLFSGDESAARDMLKRFGIDPNAPIKRADLELSGGQQQRVLLAQALAADADILILDEPCAGLDQIWRQLLFSHLKNNFKNKTVICVDHEFHTIARFFDRIYEIVGKRIYNCQQELPAENT